MAHSSRILTAPTDGPREDMRMEKPAMDDARVARVAEVRSELMNRLSPVRGTLSEDQFVRTVSLISKGLVRAEYDAMCDASPGTG